MITFNGIDIEKNFNATLLSVTLNPRKVTTYEEWLSGADEMTTLKPATREASETKIKFWIEGEKTGVSKRADVEKKISDITNIAMQAAIDYSDYDFILSGVLKKADCKKITPSTAELTLTFSSGSKISKNETIINFEPLEKQKEAVNGGNQPAPAIVKIVPTANIASIAICGLSDEPITVKHLNKNDECIIDGEKFTVTVNGTNKFNDADLWQFPHVVPGTSLITVDCAGNVAVTVKFKERWA